MGKFAYKYYLFVVYGQIVKFFKQFIQKNGLLNISFYV